MKLELHIGELVLRGFDAGLQHEIRAEVERELAALLRSETGAAPLDRRRHVFQLDAGSFRVESTSTGSMIGIQIARSVYRGIVG
jgi:hypothetical protein